MSMISRKRLGATAVMVAAAALVSTPAYAQPRPPQTPNTTRPAHPPQTKRPAARVPRMIEAVGSTLNPGDQLKPGQYLQAQGDFFAYRLIQQDDGNLVLYSQETYFDPGQPQDTNWYPQWSTGTAGYPGQGATAYMQSNGNLAVATSLSTLWNSNTDGYPGAHLALQGDGNLVIYQGTTPIWSRHMAVGWLNSGQTLSSDEGVVSHNRLFTLYEQTDGNLVLLKGTRLLWNTATSGNSYDLTSLQGDGNLVVHQGTQALWTSGTAGNPGARLAVQDDGNVVIYQGSTPLWATNTAGS